MECGALQPILLALRTMLQINISDFWPDTQCCGHGINHHGIYNAFIGQIMFQWSSEPFPHVYKKVKKLIEGAYDVDQ